LIIAAAIALALSAYKVQAGTVIPMDLNTLADHAGQVIVGTVTAVRPYWADNPRRIESEITFEQVAYLKGVRPESTTTFTLIVPGGTVGTMGMQISCAPAFAAGERWILFLLPTYKTFPVVGLSHGAFRVQTDADGVERVFHASGSPVVDIGATSMIKMPGHDDHSLTERVIEANHARVEAEPVAAQALEPISYQDFLTQIRPILDSSRDHQLTHPAGRRELVDYTPVPLVRAQPDAIRGNGRDSHEEISSPRRDARPEEKAGAVGRGQDKQ
jgi:hypothetical protein